MIKLLEYINDNTTTNTLEIQESISEMVCEDDAPISLSAESLLNALKLDGEFLVLKLHYKDYEEERKSQKIKYKTSQSLSIIVSYEDDGSSYNDIHKFVKYISDISDEKQNSTFGIKRVEKFSEFPVTILFSGILPINQLKMTVGKKVDELIHSDDEYFIPRFQKFRDDISKEIKTPILPILPRYDAKLSPYQVRLVDLHDERLISEFEVIPSIDKETIEIYLLKLFYIYKVLIEEKS